MYTKDNIKQFFLQQCNAEEAVHLANWLDKNPGALDEYITEAEWEQFQHTDLLSKKVSDAIWQKINTQTNSRKAAVYYIKRWAVAASVVLMVAVGWYVMRPRATTNTITATINKERVPQQKTEVNEGLARKTVHLNDGSTIQLMPGSSLSYPDTFMTDKRLVVLTGEAVFYVAKNAQMPFTVNSGSISTTALGTVFRVKSHEKSNHIEVSLLEGSVVVKALRAGSPFKDAYLKPGETITYNKVAETGAVVITQPSVQVKPHENVDTKARETGEHPSYVFKNEPLTKVFDKVSAIYQLNISYDKTELANMTFTASLKKGDTPETVLNAIALLNDLKIEKINGGYIVKKK